MKVHMTVFLVVIAVFLVVVSLVGCVQTVKSNTTEDSDIEPALDVETEAELTADVKYDEELGRVTIRCGGEQTTFDNVVKFIYGDPEDLAEEYCEDPIGIMTVRIDDFYEDYAIDTDGTTVLMQPEG